MERRKLKTRENKKNGLKKQNSNIYYVYIKNHIWEIHMKTVYCKKYMCWKETKGNSPQQNEKSKRENITYFFISFQHCCDHIGNDHKHSRQTYHRWWKYAYIFHLPLLLIISDHDAHTCREGCVAVLLRLDFRIPFSEHPSLHHRRERNGSLFVIRLVNWRNKAKQKNSKKI